MQAERQGASLPDDVPVGIPIANTAIVVLKVHDADDTEGQTPAAAALQVVQIAEMGEVCVLGAGVAAGYYR